MIETLRVFAIVAFVVVGLFFTFVSATGVLRLPDIYSRAHTASQADTLGAGFALAGVALALGWSATAITTVLLLFFIFITNPTAAHAIARAAHEQGIEPWTTDDDRTDAELYAAAPGTRSGTLGTQAEKSGTLGTQAEKPGTLGTQAEEGNAPGSDPAARGPRTGPDGTQSPETDDQPSGDLSTDGGGRR